MRKYELTANAIIRHYALAGFPLMNEELKKSFGGLRGTDAKAYAAVAKSWNALAVSVDELSKIKVPTLIIRGENENAFGTNSFNQFRDSVTNGKCLVVSGENHESTLKSETFKTEVCAFLREHAKGEIPER